MSTHSDCGETIKWIARDDQKWYPPMEFAGTYFIIDNDGYGQEVHAYRPHRCDPEKVEAWQEYLLKMTDLKGPESYEAKQSMHHLARERDREFAWESAFKVICPKCEAEVDERCISMSVHLRKTGEVTHTKNPHPQRLELAYANTVRQG